MRIMAFAPADPSAGRHRNKGPAFGTAPTRPGARAGVPIDVLIVHPEPEGRAVICHLLGQGDRVRVVALAGDSAQATAEAARLRPAVVVADDRLPGWDRLTRQSRVVLLTGETDPPAVATMLRGPASAYLVYDHFEPADLLGAVCAVADGLAWLSPTAASVAAAAMRESAGPATPGRPDRAAQWDHRLTRRERDVLELLCRGMSNAAIATALALTEKTVKNHLNHCYAKLGVHNRAEAVRRLAGTARET